MPGAVPSWADLKSFGRDGVTAAGSGGAALTTRLPDLLRPSELHARVNRRRKRGTVQLTDSKKTWTEEQTDQGPARWFRGVAVEVGILAERLAESLARMAARVEAENTEKVSSLEAPEPVGPLLTSHPADQFTAAALNGGAVRF
jgi:hypothetical protein